MKKIKLNLNALKVNSFITDLNKENADTVKGGTRITCLQTIGCSIGCSADAGCDPTISPGLYCSAGCEEPTQDNASVCVCA
ncbi:MAG: pinensin family lanthipeptide [Bacteroidota bacterium]